MADKSCHCKGCGSKACGPRFRRRGAKKRAEAAVKNFTARFFPAAFFIFQAALFFVPFLAGADTYDEVEGTGLLVKSNPDRAKVYIDGVERGETPFSVPLIANGEYYLRVWKEGYVERRFRVVIRSKSRIEVSLDLERASGKLVTEINPAPGAPPGRPFTPFLYIDGVRSYEKTFSLITGWHTIAVEAFGWEKYNETVYINEDEVHKFTAVLKPVPFSLSGFSPGRKRFNPKNPGALGTVEFSFTVSAPGRARFEVSGESGGPVFSGGLGPFDKWSQSASWNGRDQKGLPLPDGLYTIRLVVWDAALTEGESEWKEEWGVQIDASLEVRPLNAASANAGLFFSPSPETLPPSFYQIDGAILAGRPPLEEAWKSLPFALSFRFSPLERLEFSGAFNAVPRFSEGAVLGGGASGKWAFIRLAGAGFGMAAALSYGWAAGGPQTAFGMGTGAELSFPLSYRFLQSPVLEILVSPRFLWAGEKGYPESWTPGLGASGGLVFRYGIVLAGASLRWDIPLLSTPENSSLMSALELKIFPSNFVFSLEGGIWKAGGETGLFFGAGIGVIY